MKKILFILDHLKGGGAERIALTLAESLQKQGYEIIIALLDNTDLKMPAPNGIQQVDLHFAQPFFTGRLWQNTRKKFLPEDRYKLKMLIEDIKPDRIIVSPWRALYIATINE